MIIGSTDFYTNGFTKSSRFILMVLQPLFFTLFLFFQKKKNIYRQFKPKKLTILHLICIPVEIVLYFLFISKTIPQIMTFESRNFDIFAGITAPIAYWLSRDYVQNKRILIFWNIAALVLLASTVVIAIFLHKHLFKNLVLSSRISRYYTFPF